MPENMTIPLLFLVILAVCLPGNGVYAFGAGNIPSYAYLENRAFRHGDIEDVLLNVAGKSSAGVLGALIGKSKFGHLDVKRIYFGNWLRDYSQAVDIACLKKLPLQTIIDLIMVLGFMAHGYATKEFEVTEERIGVYLPVEHIDNPKGYGDGVNAKNYDPRLRGPVHPHELEIDPRTGMKNYIANERGSWDTSKAYVRRTLERCIRRGRRFHENKDKRYLYEAYRLLGQALHTLEDFAAHSNFCELALVSMGYSRVFTHVGSRVRIKAPNGKMVAPLVTGTFGGNDFLHSLLGEARDHINQASVSNLKDELKDAHAQNISAGGIHKLLSDVFSKTQSSAPEADRGINEIERIRAARTVGGKRPEDMTPQELHDVLWKVLTIRDSIIKKIDQTIDKIPGLHKLIEDVTDSISVLVFTALEPFLKPIMQSVTDALESASGEVINSQDQHEVFKNSDASDPTHSFLSKDHFDLILNEPAGEIAKTIVRYTAEYVAKAWNDVSVDVDDLTEDVLQCMFHPDFHDSESEIQVRMLNEMERWVGGLGRHPGKILDRLTEENVRKHKNSRLRTEKRDAPNAEGSGRKMATERAKEDPVRESARDLQENIGERLSNVPFLNKVMSSGDSHSSRDRRRGAGLRSLFLAEGPDVERSSVPWMHDTASEPLVVSSPSDISTRSIVSKDTVHSQASNWSEASSIVSLFEASASFPPSPIDSRDPENISQSDYVPSTSASSRAPPSSGASSLRSPSSCSIYTSSSDDDQD